MKDKKLQYIDNQVENLDDNVEIINGNRIKVSSNGINKNKINTICITDKKSQNFNTDKNC